MSGPFGVSMTVISGGKFSREMVVAASTFLSRSFLSIYPVATEERIRPEFYQGLLAFCRREKIDYREGPTHFSRECIKPGPTVSTDGLFWLALDPEGEALARSMFEANGVLPEERIYHAVRRLNRLEPTVPAPPARDPLWRRLFSLDPWLAVEQARYYAWFETLYLALIPWGDTIRNIQSDYS